MSVSIEPIENRENLTSLYRRKRKEYDYKTVKPKDIDDSKAEGWELDRKNQKSVRLKRLKRHDKHLEDRVWCLFYELGFRQLSGENGAKISVKSVHNQFDVVGIDEDVAIIVECKSSESLRKYKNFQNDLAKVSELRKPAANWMRSETSISTANDLKSIFFLSHIRLSEVDRERAEQAGIPVFDERDLDYYEGLAKQIGFAARYQFLADVFQKKKIRNLSIRIPTLRSRIGKYTCYAFLIKPAYLLKIAYISHRSKGKGSDVNTYQRLMKKSRLKKIRQYIADGGVFPTNIVVNLEKSRGIRFEPLADGGDGAGADYGYLNIEPTYKTAWIIDGQHRLFSYAGMSFAETGFLSVLAFEGLPPVEQAGMFININHEQKSVPRGLLLELHSELHWDSDDPNDEVKAIISRLILEIDENPDSPLFGRILTTDSKRSKERCITIAAINGCLSSSSLFISKERKGKILEYGPFWTGDKKATLRRATRIIDGFISQSISRVEDWWELGSDEGGGLAMNDGVVALLDLMKDVLTYFTLKNFQPIQMTEDEILMEVEPFTSVIRDFLAGLSKDERERFRSYRGVQGQVFRRMQLEEAVHLKVEDFQPDGLLEYLSRRDAETNTKAYSIITEIEGILQRTVIEALKAEYEGEKAWWYEGVPENVRKEASQRMEKDKDKRGGATHYLDLIDYRTIALSNWSLFSDSLAFGKTGDKKKRTQWMQWVNDIRNDTMHSGSSGVYVGFDSLARLEEYRDMLKGTFALEDE